MLPASSEATTWGSNLGASQRAPGESGLLRPLRGLAVTAISLRRAVNSYEGARAERALHRDKAGEQS